MNTEMTKLGGLAVTVRRGDIVQIGENIFLQYVKDNGSNQIIMTFKAPKEFKIEFITRRERQAKNKEIVK